MVATWVNHQIEGYDHQPAADVPKSFFAGTAGSQIATANTRFGRGFGHAGGSHTVAPGTTHRTWRHCTAMRRPTTMGANKNFFVLKVAGAPQCYAQLTTSGDIKIYRGDGTLLGTALSVIPADTWLWVEVILYIDNSGTALVFVADPVTPVLSLTSVDTQNQATNYAETADCDYGGIDHDDFHMSWGSGVPVAADALPDATCYTDFLLTQGDHADLTPSTGTSHVALLADRPAGLADGDGTYCSSNTPGHRESGLFDDLPADITDINMTQISAMIRKNDAAARSVKIGTRRSGANTDGATQNAADTYLFLNLCQALDPVTAAAWTRTNVNGTQGMVKIES